MKNRVSPTTIILTSIIVISIVIIGFQAVKTKKLKEKLLSVVPGENMSGLNLISLDNQPFDEAVFKKDRVIMFCIFEIPCASCTKNLTTWRNIVKYFGEKLTAVGVLPDGNSDAYLRLESKTSNLKLYYPGNPQEYAKKMRLKTPLSQTIVVYKGKVKGVKIGRLSKDDAMYILNLIKSVVKKGEE